MLKLEEQPTLEEAVPAISLPREVLYQIRQALGGLQYGHVTITIQDGRVMQIDRVEQSRIYRSPKQR